MQDITAMMNVAGRVRATFHVTSSKIQKLLQQIRTKDEWLWARGTKDTELESKLQKVNDDMDPLVAAFFLTEMSPKEWSKEAVSKFGEVTVAATFKRVKEETQAALEELGRDLRKVHNMQAQNLKV